MGFSPIYDGKGASAQSASAATLTPAKPTVRGYRGILIAVCFSKNNAVHSTATSGWTKFGQTNSGASFTMSVFYAAESAAAPVITWTGAAACSATVAYYASPQGDMEIAIGANSVATGSTGTHTSPSITATRDDALALYFDNCAVNASMATPSGWTEQFDGSLTTANAHIVFGDKAMPSAGGASGAISVAGPNGAWVQYQLEIYTTVPTNQSQFTKEEVVAWYDALTGLDVSKAETVAWYDALPGFDGSKMEVVAWLDLGTYPPTPTGGRRRQITNIN